MTAGTASSNFGNSIVNQCSKWGPPSDFTHAISLTIPKWDRRDCSKISGRRCSTRRYRSSQFLRAIIAVAPDTGKDRKTESRKDDDSLETASLLQPEPSSLPISLDDVNPVGLGRRSRQLFDEVWREFSGLGQISWTTRTDDKEALDAMLIQQGTMCEFAIPGAQNTTVLVVGATSRIGRIVVRKLMLRGYTVKDYNNKLAQLRAGKSSKSKLLVAKFTSADSLKGWATRQGTYFQDLISAKYEAG